jgi:hypothetical protein
LHRRRGRVKAEKTSNNKGVGSMEVECEAEIGTEQRETVAEAPAAAPPAEFEPAPPPDHARPRGSPWVKGQSGNPAGRPPRIHPPAAVAEYVIGRKTIPLAKKVRDLALSGDRSMLRLWYQHVAMSSRGSPDWSALPLVADRAELRGLQEAVAEAAAKGAITPAQADALVRIVNTVMAML